MRRSHSTGALVDPIVEPRRYIRARHFPRRIKRAMEEDQDHKPLKHFVLPSNKDFYISIVKLVLLQIMQQNQFFRLAIDNPNQHLRVFIQLIDTLKANGAPPEAIRVGLFPFYLKDRAISWLDSLLANLITTQNKLKIFIAIYFPPGKIVVLRNQITRFVQQDTKSIFDAWKRFKNLLRAFPRHGLKQWLIIHNFYNKLLYNIKMIVDAAVEGALMSPRDNTYLYDSMQI